MLPSRGTWKIHSAGLLLMMIVEVALAGDVRRPPSIVKAQVDTRYFRAAGKMVLSCSANGNPPPEYSWFHNEELVRVPGIRGQISGTTPGIIEYEGMTKGDEGTFYCVASNQYGSVRSNLTVLLQGTISDGVLEGDSAKEVHVLEGMSHQIQCFASMSTPAPRYSWCITDKISQDDHSLSSQQKSEECINVDRRIQIDNGTLYFSNVQMSDERKGQIYKCKAHNRALDTTKGGAYTILRVNGHSGPLSPRAPSILFSSGPLVTVVEGQEIVLKCFFAAYPDGSMTWSKEVDRVPSIITTGRHRLMEFNYKLTISNAQPSDAGVYRCSMSNPAGQNTHTIVVRVDAKPTVKSVFDVPFDQNITEGQTATFNCSPYAEPAPMITWWRNSEMLDENNLPMRMTLSNNNRRLTVRDVRRDSKDLGGVEDRSDLMVIQCEVTNPHGHVFYSGYLNVLKETVMTKRPISVNRSTERGQMNAMFACHATTDDSTPLSLRWFFDPAGGDELFENVHSFHQVTLSEDNRTLSIQVDNTSQWPDHEGRYKCVTDNGYSRVENIAYLRVELPATSPPPPAAEVAEASSLWWILLLVGLILLLLLLILLCCWCCWRQKGGEYIVDKKERKNGNDPVKELKNSAFSDYQRPSTDPLRGSRASLGSSIKMDSDDEGSLNEYGDIDAGKFGEDGSFIGDYNTENRRNHSYQRV